MARRPWESQRPPAGYAPLHNWPIYRITAPTLVIGGAKDVFYTRELFEETAAGVADGRAYIYPDRGHGRVSASSETSVLSLGFLLAARRS